MNSSFLFRYIAVCGLLFSFLFPTQATAEESAFPDKLAIADELTIGMGGMVSIRPYKSYKTLWTPFPIVYYEGKYAYVRGFTAGVKLINLGFLEISAFAEYDYSSFDPNYTSDNQLRKLSNRRDSASAGMGAQLITPFGMLHASGARDILGHSNGFTGIIGYMNSIEFGPLELIPATGVLWSDSNYNNYYYGVNDDESRKSGLNSYNAGGGVSPYVKLTINYSLSSSWEILCGGELEFLNNTTKNSPMVNKTSIYSLMLGLSYTF